MSHSYTLPQILAQQDNKDCSSNLKTPGFVLKFEYLGQYFLPHQKRTRHVAPRMVRVSGSLISSGSRFGEKDKEVCLEVDENNLPAPLCLMTLPPELKVQILEAMPSIELAKVGGVCKELRDLANDNELWKHKFAEEFSQEFFRTREVVEPWRVAFRRQWERKKKQQRKKLVEKERRIQKHLEIPVWFRA
ncbi:hypothetical protein ACLB2K_047828 [Fragaria x ananassa]